jgi:isochorismate synthase EntC
MSRPANFTFKGAPPYDDLTMLQGRFFLELNPNQILLCEGPWIPSTGEDPWEIAILPFKPLTTNSPRFLNAKRSTIVSREDLSQCANGKRPQNLDFSSSNREIFTKSFEKLKNLIQTTTLLKGVPWAFQTAPAKQSYHFWESLLGRTESLPQGLNLYGAELVGESILGASPEWLFRISAGAMELETVALAGTRWPDQNRSEAIEKKDAFEHELVVNEICSKLKSFGEVIIGEKSWVKAASVEHLKTTIKLKATQKLDPVTMLSLLHPTPAVGVFPHTPEGDQWLYELPFHEERKDFAAPWVVHNRQDGRAWALVGIRQIRLRENDIMIPAGCGVVSDSVEEVEWSEIQEKIQSVKKGWGLLE